METGLDNFRRRVLRYGEDLYRDFLWRRTTDPYEILVSEVMLQQTQVGRVEKKYPEFLAHFPCVDALAAASKSDVLELWQGMGYNRRALALKAACEQCAFAGGVIPNTAEALRALPGVGPSTAAGVLAFAYDKPCVYLETNVRTVFIYELFSDAERVSDKELIPLVEEACPKSNVRGWYYALLDYGAYLKKTLPRAANPSRRSAGYVRQSNFEGSRRQKRAEIVRIVLAAGAQGISVEAIAEALNTFETHNGRERVLTTEACDIIDELVRDGFFARVGDRCSVC